MEVFMAAGGLEFGVSAILTARRHAVLMAPCDACFSTFQRCWVAGSLWLAGQGRAKMVFTIKLMSRSINGDGFQRKTKLIKH